MQVLKHLVKVSGRKDEFLSSMSHNMEKPLRGIIEGCEQLLDGSFGELGETVESTVGVIEMSAHSLLRLIQDILDAVRLKKGKMATVKQEVSSSS